MQTTSSILRYILLFIVLFTTVLFFYHGFNGLSFAGISKSLFHADFYINYEGGFMRRGLDGEMIYLVSKAFNISPITIQKIYNTLFFVIFIVCIAIFLIKNKPPFYVMFSMSVLLLYLYYLNRGIRKDHILLVFFILNLFTIKKVNTKWLSFILQNVILIVGILMHEIFLIITIFPLLIINNLKYNEQFTLKEGAKIFSYFIPAYIVFIIVSLFFPGDTTQKFEILNSWKQLGINESRIGFNPGIFEDPQYIWKFGITFNQYIFFAIVIFIHFFFVGIAIINALPEKQMKCIFIIILILQYGASIFLSIVATDHSRWVFFANITSILATYFIKNNISVPEKFTFPQGFYSILYKLRFAPYFLFFFASIGHGGWHGVDDYIKSHPANLISQILFDDYLYRSK